MKVSIFAGGGYTTISARILPLAKALENYGIKCKLITPIPWYFIAKDKLGKILSSTLTFSFKKYIETLQYSPDLIIIGKSSNLEAYLLVRIMKCRKINIIFDLDDALFLPVGNIFGINIRPGSFYLEKIIKKVDFVTTNGHYLLNYVKKFNKNTCIIHDPIDTKLFHPKKRRKNDDKITITWEGNAKVNYENLTLLINPLQRIGKKYGKKVKFKIVSYLGDRRIKEIFSILKKYISIDYGSEKWLPLREFARFLYDSDIMVAPLKKNPWYEGKSALRIGIGMAMGVPVVASPVGEQKYVIKHGVNGFLAKNEDEWYNYLKILIENDELRSKIGQKGRETAERELALEVNGKKLYEIIKNITLKK